MSYSTIEAALQDVLQAATAAFPETVQVTRGDWSILDRGVNTAVILFPGPFEENGFGANNTVNITWTLQMHLVQRVHEGVGAAIETFVQLRDTVRDHIQKYPTLGLVGVLTSLGMSGAGPEGTYDKDNNGPFHIIEMLTLQVQEENTQTLA